MFGVKEKEPMNTTPITPTVTTCKREKLLITPKQIKELSVLASKAESAGFQMAVQIENDSLVLKFKNDELAIDSDEFECDDIMDVPTGPQAAENVKRFSKTYLPGEEIKKKQRTILDNNEALTSETVKNIENTVTNNMKAINALSNILSSMPVRNDKKVIEHDDLDKTMPIPIIKEDRKK